MKIKKYISKTLNEGKLKIKQELGGNAIILSSRKAKKASTGEEFFEIVAAVDNNVKESTDEQKKVDLYSRAIGTSHKSANGPAQTDIAKLSREIKNLKETVSELSDAVKYKYSSALGPVFGELYKLFRKAEISEELSLKIIGNIAASGMINDLPSAVQQAKYFLKEKITTVAPLQKNEKLQKIMLFGSTGTGKTSSLVKIALICKLVMKAYIMIISADTYKVGGAEQLETFASISNLPFKSVYSAEELEELAEHEKNRDFIFLDTPGRSHLNSEFLDELEVYADKFKPDKRFLTMSATKSEESLRSQLQMFSKIKPDGVVLTKIDECNTLGNIISVLKDMPVNYICTGQNIPEDIEPASKELLVKYILPDNLLKNEV